MPATSGGQWHARQPFRHEHILHASDRQAEQLRADHHRDVFGELSAIAFVLLCHGYAA
jgi:hypothetical protein